MSRRADKSRDRSRRPDQSGPPGAAKARAATRTPAAAAIAVPTPERDPLSAWACGLILLLILIGGLAFQWPHLTAPILERVHGWRQAQTAMTARNFVRDGMNPFFARVDYIGDGQMQLEFPLYQYVVAICYLLFGIDEFWGRVVAMLFGMGSAVLTFFIGRSVWNGRVGLMAAALFTFSPLNIFFNRAFMPDSSTIFFTLLALWAFLRFFQTSRVWPLVVACTAITFALAGKPPIALSVAPPLAVAMFLTYGLRFWRQGRLIVGLAAALLLFVGWMKYSSFINNERSDKLIEGTFTNAGEFNQSLVHWYFGSPQQRADARTYARIFRRVPDWVGHWGTHAETSGILESVRHWGVVALALLGVALSWRTRMQWILPAWFLGCLAYVLVFLNVNFIHNYYQMPIIPMLALAAALGVDRLLAAVERLAARIRPAALRGLAPGATLIGVIAFGAVQAHGGHVVLRDYNADTRAENWTSAKHAYWDVLTQMVELGRRMHAQLPDNGGLLALTGDLSRVGDVRDPQLLYYVDRRGFVIQGCDEIAAAIEKELKEDVARGALPRTQYAAQRRKRIHEWVDRELLNVLAPAIEKGVRTLAIANPNIVLSAETWKSLTTRYRLHHRDPAGQYAVFDLTHAR